MTEHTGSCLCGAVRYVVDGALAPIELCHCSQCRKAQGSAFAANIPVVRAAFRLLEGQDRLRAFSATPGKRRVFCGDCGAPVYSERDAAPGMIRLRAGLLDAPVRARPGLHFHVASAADWWEIAGDLPCYPGPVEVTPAP